MNTSLLEIRALSKGFPGVRALDGVDFTVRRGEIHALMGENGGGKSTLIKVLTGVYERDSGETRLEGNAIQPRSPREAEACGISTVYQEVNLIPHLSVAENICLWRQPTRFGKIQWRAIEQRAKQALARLELDIDVSRQLSSCSIAIQQMVAMARALDVSAKLLILDEPTSSLNEREVAELFKVIRKLRDEGMGIVFVTHFMDQVYAVTDRITVLRNCRLVGEYPTAELPRLQLVARMIGKDVKEVEALSHKQAGAESVQEGAPFLEVKDFGRKGSIQPLDLSIRAGEVVGLAGLLGSGRTGIPRLMGVPIASTKIGIYSLAGFCSALAACVSAFYMQSGNPGSFVGLELDAIASVVIGGMLLTGGVGFIPGTMMGVLILGLIQTLVTFQGNLNTWWTKIAVGFLLLLFIVLQKALGSRANRTS